MPAVPSFLIAAILGASLAIAWHNGIPPNSFKAFYCAGRVIDRRGDPYRVEPLRACEQRVAPEALPPYAVEPAPLPGYALAPFALVAVMPYRAAQWTYVTASLIALLAIGFALSRITRAPAVPCTLAMSGLWYLNLQYGEIASFATAGVVVCAYALQDKRYALAAAGAMLVAVEPHVALPLWLSLALFAPRSRAWLAMVGAALITLDVAVGGLAQIREYFSAVLPAQALAEVHANDQFSLTHQLALFGVPDRTALLFGSLSYAVMLVIGCYVARSAARANAAPEYLALAPPAFALLGGTFVHDVQFMAALPLAVTELARRRSGMLVAGTLLVSIAWGSGVGRFGLIMSACSALAVVSFISLRSPRRTLYESAALVLLVLAVGVNLHETPADPITRHVQIVAASAWSPAAWQAYLDATPSRTQPHLFDVLRKLPTWIGFLIVLVEVSRAAVPPSPLIRVMSRMLQATAFIDDPPPPASSHRHL